MKRRIVAVVLATVLGAVCITGCGNTQEAVESTVQVSTEAQTTQQRKQQLPKAPKMQIRQQPMK